LYSTFCTECWPFCLIFNLFLFSKSSSLFIDELRDVGNLAVTSTCLAWSFDSSPLIIFLIWYSSYEELISNPFRFQRNNVCCNVVVILVLIWRQVTEKVVAETSAELVVIHFVHCPLSTLVKELLMRYASDDHCFWWPCFWWCVFRSSSSDSFLQTQFFRCILQMHSSRCFSASNKFLCSWLVQSESLWIVLWLWSCTLEQNV